MANTKFTRSPTDKLLVALEPDEHRRIKALVASRGLARATKMLRTNTEVVRAAMSASGLVPASMRGRLLAALAAVEADLEVEAPKLGATTTLGAREVERLRRLVDMHGAVAAARMLHVSRAVLIAAREGKPLTNVMRERLINNIWATKTGKEVAHA